MLPVVTTVDFTALSLYRFSLSLCLSLSVCLSQYHNPCEIKFLSSSWSSFSLYLLSTHVLIDGDVIFAIFLQRGFSIWNWVTVA